MRVASGFLFPTRLMLAALVLGMACRDLNVTAPSAAPGATRSVNSASVALETFYGPERFIREPGAPLQVTRTISTVSYEAPFVLHVENGDRSGNHVVTSGSVSFDGRELLRPSDFKQAGGAWTFPVSPGASATLEVTLASAPGSGLNVWLEGKRRGVLFCPSGERGAHTNLSEAIAASPDNGTVLVCDGEHVVDSAHVTRPVTIRSEHPHGATLVNADQGDLPQQQGRPSIQISNVPGGLVRIVDLAFKPRYRAITGVGTYDQVQIDSISIVATDYRAVGWEGFASTVPTAKVEITNSHFEHLGLALFPVAPVETNMSYNTFDDHAALYFSGNAAAHTYSFGRAEYNRFTRCGASGCLRAVAAGNIVIAHNVLDVSDDVPRSPAAMVVTRSVDAPGRTPMVVEDNDIIGTAPTGTPSDPASWSTPVGIQVKDRPAVVNILRNNRITNAYTGVQVAADIDMQDNVVANAAFAFQQTASGAVTIQRNDFTGLVNAFAAPTPAGTATYACNWWGSASGPSNPPSNTGRYAPWATQRIANTTVSCDPTAVPLTVRACPEPGPSGTTTVPTIREAYDVVASGGTVLVCDGTFVVTMDILKPVTITAEGPGMPTLDASGADKVFQIANAGPVTISSLRLTGSTHGLIGVGPNVPLVNIVGNEFHPHQTNAYGVEPRGFESGIVTGGTGGGETGTINIDHNTFIGGDIGTTLGASAGVTNVTNNTFSDMVNTPVNIPSIAGGRISVAGNTFENCSDFVCVYAGQSATITGNTFIAHIGRPVRTFIQAGSELTSAPPTVLIEDNTFTGVGSGDGNRSGEANYPVLNQAIVAEHATATVRRNQIKNVYAGITARSDGVVNASDNGIRTTFAPFGGAWPGNGDNVIVANWNDLSDYVTGVGFLAVLDLSKLDLRCNWWGQPAGPTAIDPQVTSSTPAAPAPVAGQPHTGCSLTATPPALAMGAISAGQSHTCSLATTGTAYCWGNGGSGALGAGSGSTNGSSSPVAVAGTHTFTAISAGNLHSCALAAAGSAYCWGLNAYGGLGDGSTTNSTVPVPLSGGLALSSVSAGGDYHSCGVTTAGAAFCWGNNASGQLGTGASSGPQTVPVAAAGGLVFKAISTRANTTCALTATGAAYCWGYNGYGQLGDGSRDNSSAPVAVAGGLSFLTISVGYYHVCGRTSGGIYCWGRNESGELGDGSTTDRSGPVLVSGSTAFTTVSAGADDGNGYSCGLTSGGAAYCWGYNATGLLGNGSTTNSSVPMPVAGGIQFSSISAGGDHACGVATGGVLYCWGSDAYGQLGNGNGSFTNSSVPVVVLPP